MKPSARAMILHGFIIFIFVGFFLGCSKDDSDDIPVDDVKAEEVAELEAIIKSPSSDPDIYTGDSITYESRVTGGYEPYTFSWDLNGDGEEDSDLENPGGYVYDNAGVFVVTLQVTDSKGEESEYTRTVNVQEDLFPTAVIDEPAQNITVYSGTNIKFSSTTSGGNEPLSFSWDFGGGADNRSVEDPGNVFFNTPGIFSVTFSATDDNGDVASDTVVISVRQYVPVPDTDPIPHIDSPIDDSGYGIRIYVGDSLNFQGSVTDGNPPFTYLWYFPGGHPGSSSLEDPGMVTYTSSASYTATFTVRDNDYDFRHTSVSVRVLPRTITLPDLSGMNLYNAIALLEESFLNVGTVYCEYNDTAPTLNVIGQSPGSGSSLKSGSSVDLTVSLGSADGSSYWSHKGTMLNTNYMGLWFANHDLSVDVGAVVNGYTEYVLDQTDPNYVSTWNNCAFTAVPVITLENVNLSVEENSVPVTAEGSISGSGTFTNARIRIQNGTYAGNWFSVGTYDLSGFTGSIYGFGDSNSSEWYGITEGDINGFYNHNGDDGVLYIASMNGVQTSGTMILEWGTPTNIYSGSFEDIELFVHHNVAWSGTASGYYTGDFEHGGETLYIPMYRAGRYSGTSTDDYQLNSYLSLVQATDPLDATIILPSGNVTIVQGDKVDFRGYVSGSRWPYTIAWDFDGDDIADSEEIIPGKRMYSSVGTYSATFSVTDSEGLTITDSIEVTVNEADTAPEAAIITPSENQIIFQGSTLDFEASVTGGNEPVAYSWDFNGDGTPDTTGSLTASYTFDAIGEFNATFTATDRDDDSSSDSVTITVSTMQVVPDLAGLSFSASALAISAENLIVGTCYVEHSSSVGAGNVISQDPPFSTGVLPGTAVDLVVSLGPPDANSVWSQIGLTTGSFPSYIPPINTPVSIINTLHQDPFAVNDACNSTSEYLSSLVTADNHADWSGVFSSAPPIQWIDPVTNANVSLQQAIGLTGTVTGETSEGLIEGDIVSSQTRYTIASGDYSGYLFSRISWELGDYTGIMYAIGNSSTGDFLGETLPGDFWGRVDGDIKGMYRTISLNQAEIYITSIGGVQASGTLDITWNGTSYGENSTLYDNIPVYVQEGIAWSGEGSGCVTGNLVHSGTSVYLPGFNVGQYSGTWFYYETNPNYYDQSGYIFTYLHKSNSSASIVPFVEGLSRQGAEKIITSQGLAVGTVTSQSSDYPSGHVVSQNPVSGTTTSTGATVNLVVSE